MRSSAGRLELPWPTRRPLTLPAAPREPWRERAACRDLPLAMFFPERGQPGREAKAVCARCPVRRECREYAEGDPEAMLHGVWGGTTAKERARERREPA